MIAGLYIHRDAASDLESVRSADAVAAARIVALLQQLKADPDLLDRLTQDGFDSRYQHGFQVGSFQSQQRQKQNLWRLKVWDLCDRLIPYRVVYAFDQKGYRHIVLGIVHRNFGYDAADPRTRRIVAAYERLGIQGA